MLAAAGLLTILVPAVADAADAPAESAKKSATKPSKKSGKSKRSAAKTGTPRAGGKKVISIDDDFLVEGKLDKPSAFFILKRSATDYDWARLNVELAPLVLESVQDPLF